MPKGNDRELLLWALSPLEDCPWYFHLLYSDCQSEPVKIRKCVFNKMTFFFLGMLQLITKLCACGVDKQSCERVKAVIKWERELTSFDDFKLSLWFEHQYSCALVDSCALSSNLNLFKFSWGDGFRLFDQYLRVAWEFWAITPLRWSCFIMTFVTSYDLSLLMIIAKVRVDLKKTVTLLISKLP